MEAIYVSPKRRWIPVELQDITTQKIILFIVTAVRTSNPAFVVYLSYSQ
jgi:hypothetical protein